MADVILLVAQLELSSLRNVVRMLLSLDADETIGKKVHIVLNRVGSENDISLKKAEETIGKPIYWQIPNDPRTMVESRNQGVPLIQLAPRGKLQQSIAGLAEALSGKPLQPNGKDRGSRWNIFRR
jgi:pilus assembly protein CpaE